MGIQTKKHSNGGSRGHHSQGGRSRPGCRDSRRNLDPFAAEVDPDLDYDRFLVLKSDTPIPLSKVDVFDVYEDFVAKCGEPAQMWPRGDGCLVVETRNKEQCSKVLNLDSLGSTKVSQSSHPTFNTCKGVIRSGELLDYSTDRLLSKLESQKVVNIHRVTRNVGGVKVPSSTLILTFKLLTPPTKIRVGYLNIPVSPYVEYPRRCFLCQRFGHVSSKCRWERVCLNCAKPSHGSSCTVPPSCANCRGDHAASSKQCGIFLFEKEVLALRNKERISFKEAKDRVRGLYIEPASVSPVFSVQHDPTGLESSSVVENALCQGLPLQSCVSPLHDLKWRHLLGINRIPMVRGVFHRVVLGLQGSPCPLLPPLPLWKGLSGIRGPFHPLHLLLILLPLRAAGLQGGIRPALRRPLRSVSWM